MYFKRLTSIMGFLCAILFVTSALDTVRSAEIEWEPSLEAALERARVENAFVMVDFYTSWCKWCKELESRTYTDAGVIEMSRKLVNVKVDAEARVDAAVRYQIGSYPTIVFLRPDGTVRERVIGFRDAKQFRPIQQKVLDTRGEQFALRIQIEDRPADPALRRAYADVLMLGGAHGEAAAQLDSLLVLTSEELRPGVELERAIAWLHAGALDRAGNSIRAWLEQHPEHPRRVEGLYFLARFEEIGGVSERARDLYRQVEKAAPGTWLAEAAKGRRARLKGERG